MELWKIDLLQDVANRKIRSIGIELDDLSSYKGLDEELLDRVRTSTRPYSSENPAQFTSR